MTEILAEDHPSAWADGVVMPALLRFAWRTYGGRVRAALTSGGYDDLPRNGAYVIGAMANDTLTLGGDGADASSAAAGLAEQLGVSKQAVSQLLDTLVMRGYLHRDPDPSDRRRMAITLTERGQAAAALVSSANRAMDEELERHIGADGVRTLRRSLAGVMYAGRMLREAQETESPAEPHH